MLSMTTKAAGFPFTKLRAALPGLWIHVRRWGPLLFGILVFGLLASQAHKIDWAGAWSALKRYEPMFLLKVLGLATVSHALYACFDLVGRRHTRHKLPRVLTWCIALVSYAFTLNLGSLIGGVATRVRLYMRAGLDEVTIAQIVGVSVATNWMGYALVAGGLFAAGAISPPAQLHVSATTFQTLGVGMLLLAYAYVAACALAKGRVWRVRRRNIRLPTPVIAVVQLAVSAANWSLMGAVMYLLLGEKVPYATTLSVLLAASIIGVLTPVPAGLGVLEAVYLALLSGTVPQGTLMGAVLAYRALYYVVPLGGALLLYLGLERYMTTHVPVETSPPKT
jgi:uncharacterized membrane protein YbhN (UPF0104 family)